ncbi:MAG: YbaB/EbfC family nucleoid-associated protein [bacterium]|nr:YbaB/EbfC family nucleoid-associated protein [bacterium]
MFGKVGDMGGMIKKAMEMKKEMANIKEELETTEVQGVCGSSIQVTATGTMKIKSIKIAPECVKQGETENLEDMVLIAVNNAIDEAQKVSQSKMSAVTGGLNIPGLFE